MIDFCEAVFDAKSITDAIKMNNPIIFCAFALGKLDAIVGQDRVNFVRYNFGQYVEKVSGNHACGAGMKLGNIDMEVANRVSGKLLSFRLIPFDIWQSADAVPLKTAMQG